MDESRGRDSLEVLMHHIKVIATGNVDEIMEDYDENIIGFSYEDDGIQLINGSRDLREQVKLVCTKDGTPPNLENGPLEITYLQGIGDYAVLALHADPFDVFGAHTYISRNGRAVYTTSYSHQPHRFVNGEKPVRVGELSESGQHTRDVVEAYLQALAADNLAEAKAMRSDKTLLIADFEKQIFIGQEAVSIFWEKERNRLRAGKPHYIVDEAEGPLAFLVYKNEQGITAETYLIEEDRVVFEAIVHRDGIYA